MTPFWSKVLVAVASSGILAGGSGVFIAGGTAAEVEALKEAQPRIEQRLGAVEQELSGLKGAVEARERADAEHREAQRQSLDNLDRKLDRLLTR